MDSPEISTPMRATRELIRSSSTSLAHLPLAMPRSAPASEKSSQRNRTQADFDRAERAEG